MLTAAGVRRLCSSGRRHSVHHDASKMVLLLERPDVPKTRTLALRHAAHAHTRKVSGFSHAAVVEKVTITPERWHEASHARCAVVLSTAEESRGAEDDR